MNKTLLPILFLIGIAVFAWIDSESSRQANSSDSGFVQNSTATEEVSDPLARAFANRESDVQVEGQGTVARVLPDDNKGSRHQKFILKLSDGQTVLVAHNIDLAPRIPNLRKGDTVEFAGEYEWNAQGGVIHWTHHDPQGRHKWGWLKHKGELYQ